MLEENLGYTLDDSREQSEAVEDSDVPRGKVQPPKQSVIDLTKWSKADLDKSKPEPGRNREIVSKPPIKPSLPLPARPGKQTNTRSEAAAEAERAAFIESRKQQAAEKKRRDAEAAAKAKKRLPNTMANLTAGEGSALGNIGNLSREHVKKASADVMVESDSDADDSDDIGYEDDL